ncbi:restriction endonuclease subunit S [Planococcus versutus]|uniref:restriction endonuclease subunit S n=1 Tax=Planococcus versutus TaxID=1302659 RepID=UPI0006723B1D|nr:restriction endonuclease subunit S [Planococcus versutus]
MNVPQLRFNGFDGEWKQQELSELLEFKNGINADKDSYGHGTKFINVLDILNNYYILSDKIIGSVNASEKQLETYAITYGDMLFLRSSETREDVGRCNVYLDQVKPAVFGGFVIRGKKIADYSPFFLKAVLNNSSARNQISSKAGGSTRYNVGQSILSEVTVRVPKIEEQQKISSFLMLLNKKNETQQEKIEKLEQFKKGMMQKVFSQELRFKDEDGGEFGEWELQTLNNFTKRVVRKNIGIQSTRPLTISAQQGLVDQKEFFNKNIASKNTEGYYLLKNGEFAYNKSYSNGYPWGAIKRLDKYKDGVLSTLYICFEPIENVNSDFLSIYFETTFWYKEVSLISGEGARNHGLLNIGVNDFFETQHNMPRIKEQQKIAGIFMQLNRKIDKEKEKLMVLEEQKKGFMQGMFC